MDKASACTVSVEPSDAPSSAVIAEEAVVLAQRDKTYRLFRLKRGRKLNFDKVSFYPDGAFGCLYGSSFKVDKKQLVLVENSKTEFTEKLKGELASAPDNRGVFDDGEAQELTEDDVVAMKGQGVKGQAIVESMVEHSSSFKEKTKFSQEKYIRKKEKKHNPVFRIVRPSTRLLCSMYREVAPAKICFLREDTLAQMLTMSNVHAGSNMIIMETCQGFLTGALLERMGGLGNLVQVFFGDFPVRIGNLLNREQQGSSTVLNEVLLTLREEASRTSAREERLASDKEKETEFQDKEPPVITTQDTDTVAMEIETDNAGTDVKTGDGEQSLTSGMERAEIQKEEPQCEDHDHEVSPVVKRLKLDAQVDGSGKDADDSEKSGRKFGWANDPQQSTVKESKRQRKEQAYKEAAELLSQRKMDGLVIASRFHPEPVLMSLVHLLAPSRTIVVYYHLLEPLVQCYKNLKDSGLAFNIQISESWMRHYQVLEDRTHPLMNMSGQSGYLLTATTIKPSNSS